MRFSALIAMLMVAILALGCGNRERIQHPEIERIGQFAVAYHEAVERDDVDAVYEMLDASVQRMMPREAFRDYYAANRLLFVEYGLALESALSAEMYDIRARRVGDSCGAELVLGEHQTWEYARLPEIRVSTEGERMRQWIEVVQSRQFIQALKAYALEHPEFDGALQREIRRAVVLEGAIPGAVWSYGNRVQIALKNVGWIEMRCTRDGWRIDRCTSYHSTK